MNRWPKMTGEKSKILITEDEPDVIRMYGLLLSKTGYTPLLAVDGANALNFLGNGEDISLAIFDYGLPDIDGPTLTRCVREDPKYARHSKMPIIVGSANHSKLHQQKKEAIEAGANWYMEKPFEPMQLLAKIKELLGEKPQEREQRY